MRRLAAAEWPRPRVRRGASVVPGVLVRAELLDAALCWEAVKPLCGSVAARVFVNLLQLREREEKNL